MSQVFQGKIVNKNEIQVHSIRDLSTTKNLLSDSQEETNLHRLHPIPPGRHVGISQSVTLPLTLPQYESEQSVTTSVPAALITASLLIAGGQSLPTRINIRAK